MKPLNHLSFSQHNKPKKLIFMLHGYGDTAKNFINVANLFQMNELEINFIALDAPSIIPNYPSGRQWFDLYPNGIYISEAGEKEKEIIKVEISSAIKKIEDSIITIKNKFGLNFSDCFLMGFSQGGMMTFEFGNYLNESLGGFAILSGRIFEKKILSNKHFKESPIFISHGKIDEIIPISYYYKSCEFLKRNFFKFENHLLENDTHTISLKAIEFLQKFIKKNL